MSQFSPPRTITFVEFVEQLRTDEDNRGVKAVSLGHHLMNLQMNRGLADARLNQEVTTIAGVLSLSVVYEMLHSSYNSKCYSNSLGNMVN